MITHTHAPTHLHPYYAPHRLPVLAYWDNIQAQLDIDLLVLDDLEVEARGVARHNPWLTYSEGLHQLREFGTAVAALDVVSERQLDKDEIRAVVEALFVAADSSALHTTAAAHTARSASAPRGARQASAQPLPDTEDWPAFCRAVDRLQQGASAVYCPLRQCQRPWIDLSALARYEADPLRLLLDQVRY